MVSCPLPLESGCPNRHNLCKVRRNYGTSLLVSFTTYQEVVVVVNSLPRKSEDGPNLFSYGTDLLKEEVGGHRSQDPVPPSTGGSESTGEDETVQKSFIMVGYSGINELQLGNTTGVMFRRRKTPVVPLKSKGELCFHGSWVLLLFLSKILYKI